MSSQSTKKRLARNARVVVSMLSSQSKGIAEARRKRVGAFTEMSAVTFVAEMSAATFVLSGRSIDIEREQVNWPLVAELLNRLTAPKAVKRTSNITGYATRGRFLLPTDTHASYINPNFEAA